jgi:ABC-type branched-subunit amino acid transport system substrate-binding protein
MAPRRSSATSSSAGPRARWWLSYIVRRHGEEDRADTARLRLARLEHQRGNPEAARRLLKQLRFSRLDQDQREGAYRLLADVSGDPVEKLRWLAPIRTVAVEREDAEEVAAVDREIDVLLDGMSADELGRAVDQLERRIPAGRVRLRLAERALDAGDFDRAERELARSARLELAPEYRDTLGQLRRRFELREQLGIEDGLPSFAEVARLPPPRTEGAQGSLGVALPLSGPFAAYGRESLRGVLLAARIFDETDRVASLELLGTLEGDGDLEGGAEPGAPLGVDAGLDAELDPGPAPRREPSLEAALESDGPLRIVVRDTQGSPEGAARAVRELARDRRVSAIVGPLLSGESEAAAAAADEAGIPLIALTSREEVPRNRSNVFRLRTTPEEEVRRLVDYASERLEARRYAILYPRDNYGRGMRDRFWKAVDEAGGWVVAVSSYDPTATDFAEPIRRMIGYQLLTPAEESALEERAAVFRRARRLAPEVAGQVREVVMGLLGPEIEPLPPRVDFDALFIPDSYDKVVLIAPQLAFHEITGVRLLGPGAWNHPDLLRIAYRHVRGAVISAPFHVESQYVFVSRFVERYTTTYGETPDLFAAQGFDAANLILVQLAAGRDSRSLVREGVLHTQGYPGVSGVTSFLPDGNARKLPYLLGVRGGKIISLD